MTSPMLYIHQAVPADVDTIWRWRHETAEWLRRTHGTDQWSIPYPRERVERWVERGETFMVSLESDGEYIATLTSSAEGDPELWTPEELAEPARYVSKVNVIRKHAGREIGATLFAWARDRAAAEGAEFVRIDVWSTNEKLQDYYRRLGFRYLRTVPDVWPPSGALYEILADRVLGLPVVEMLDQDGDS